MEVAHNLSWTAGGGYRPRFILIRRARKSHESLPLHPPAAQLIAEFLDAGGSWKIVLFLEMAREILNHLVAELVGFKDLRVPVATTERLRAQLSRLHVLCEQIPYLKYLPYLQPPMKKIILFAAASFATSTWMAQAATVVLDSKDSAGLVTTGSQATFGVQSFKLSVAGAGTNDTVTANSPLPSTATIQNITFVRAPSGTATAGALYVKLYDNGANATGTPLAVSTNSIDVNGAAVLTDLVWNFGSPSVSTTSTLYAVFSTNGLADSTGTDLVGARIAAANFGGGFTATVYGGADTNLRGWNSANPPVGQNLDARFKVNFTVVPEPSAALLGGLGVLGLLRRRRVA